MDDTDYIIHERAVLASLMLDMEEHGYFFNRLIFLDFSAKENQALFTCLHSMRKDGVKLDLRLIKMYLDLRSPDNAWTLESLWDLIKTADITNGGHDHLRKLIKHSVARQLQTIKEAL